MKTLNIDELAVVTRTITIGGKTYPVKEMTVENFVETTREANRLQKSKDATPADQVEMASNAIARSIPECPKGELLKLSLEQLFTIGRFIRGEMDVEGEMKETSEGGKAVKAKKK